MRVACPIPIERREGKPFHDGEERRLVERDAIGKSAVDIEYGQRAIGHEVFLGAKFIREDETSISL